MYRYGRILNHSLFTNSSKIYDHRITSFKLMPCLRTLSSIPPFIPPHIDQNEEKKEIRKSLIQKYWGKTKNMGKQYGWVFIGTYWVLWGGITYGYYQALDTGLLAYQDWQWLHLPKIHQQYYSWGKWMGFDMTHHLINENKEKILIALVLGKVSKVVYLPFSVAITPSLARFIGKAPQESKKTLPEIKERIEEIKEEIKKDIKKAI